MIQNYEKLLKCFKASCRVQTPKALGSCTIIYSKGGNTYALTNFHVIENCITYKEKWDNILKKDIKKEFTKQVEVLYPRMEDDRVVGYATVLADIVLHDKQQDIALLKFKNDTNKYPSVKWFPRDEIKKIPYLTELACIGAALGYKPIVTFGNLNSIGEEIDNYEYWMSSAQSIFGNSGGGIFAEKDSDWLFLGIPSRIAVIPMGFGANAITHMGFFIPLFRIYDWLEENCYQFIYDSTFTIEQCEELRDKKKEEGIINQLIKKKL